MISSPVPRLGHFVNLLCGFFSLCLWHLQCSLFPFRQIIPSHCFQGFLSFLSHSVLRWPILLQPDSLPTGSQSLPFAPRGSVSQAVQCYVCSGLITHVSCSHHVMFPHLQDLRACCLFAWNVPIPFLLPNLTEACSSSLLCEDFPNHCLRTSQSGTYYLVLLNHLQLWIVLWLLHMWSLSVPRYTRRRLRWGLHVIHICVYYHQQTLPGAFKPLCQAFSLHSRYQAQRPLAFLLFRSISSLTQTLALLPVPLKFDSHHGPLWLPAVSDFWLGALPYFGHFSPRGPGHNLQPAVFSLWGMFSIDLLS